MRKLGSFLVFSSFFLFAGCASATTYYISFSSGSNSNNGTSESTPWKSHPYMQTKSGCTGTGSAPNYNHSAGDQFVFKQGDSWPNACFDMVIQNSGASGNPDVYTFDPTWGTAGGTTGNLGQPVGVYQFNAGGAVINGSDNLNTFIRAEGLSYITLNGMEFTGFTWSTNTNSGNGPIVDVGVSSYIVVSNFWMHAWTHPGASSDLVTGVNASTGANQGIGIRVTGGVFDGLNSGGSGVSDSGSGTFGVQIVDNTIFRNAANGINSNMNAIIHDNLIGPITQSFDSSVHENCIEPTSMPAGLASTILIYNNVVHDCTAVALLTQGAPPSSGWEIDYIWNNVFYIGTMSNPPIPMQFAALSSSNSNSQVHAWNNTIYAGSSQVCFRTPVGSGNFGVLDLQNNLCISDAGLIAIVQTGNTYTNNNNVLMGTSAAASQGFTSSGQYAYAPTASTNGTVGAGVNLASLATGNFATLLKDTTYAGTRTTLSRPSGAWDVGAYQYGASSTSGTPTPPTNVKVLVVQ